MEIEFGFKIAVEEWPSVSEARRQAAFLATKAGFKAGDAGAVSIIVAEMATNLVKYAQGGEIILQTLESQGRFGMELVALDRGPGMDDESDHLRNGFSMGQTLGIGLGAVRRLSTDFDIYSAPGRGTAVVSRYWPSTSKSERDTASEWDIGALCIPKPREAICGDSFAIRETPHGLSALVADGLGHGPFAAEASQGAAARFRESSHLDPIELIRLIHTALIGTRGAAIGLAGINTIDQSISYAGVGNIFAAFVGRERTRQMLSLNGTAGLLIPLLQEFKYPWPVDSTLVMHSDGISSRWVFHSHPEFIEKDPTLVSALLYRDFGGGTDDSTVVVIRRARQSVILAT